MCTQPVAKKFCRESYSDPDAVYEKLKSLGMDLVTITDHDSIDGALDLLNQRPDLGDVIVGEEVSCRFPDDEVVVHLAVYGMTESLHRELQPLRGLARGEEHPGHVSPIRHRGDASRPAAEHEEAAG